MSVIAEVVNDLNDKVKQLRQELDEALKRAQAAEAELAKRKAAEQA